MFPEIDGGVVFDGGSGDTTRVGAEIAGLLDPLALVAVSCTRIVCPTSALVSVNLRRVAPPIAAQPLPELSQSSHW